MTNYPIRGLLKFKWLLIDTIAGPWFSLGFHIDFQRPYLDIHFIWWIITIGNYYEREILLPDDLQETVRGIGYIVGIKERAPLIIEDREQSPDDMEVVRRMQPIQAQATALDYSIEDAIMASCPHGDIITLCGDCGKVMENEKQQS